MFWDTAPLVPSRSDYEFCLEFYQAKHEVLEATLALDSVACQRGALHGRGHEYFEGRDFGAKDRVPAIINRWLDRNPDAPDELRDYAVQASTGRIL